MLGVRGEVVSVTPGYMYMQASDIVTDYIFYVPEREPLPTKGVLCHRRMRDWVDGAVDLNAANRHPKGSRTSGEWPRDGT